MIVFDGYTVISIVSAIIYLTLLAGILLLMRGRISQLLDVLRSRRRLDPARKSAAFRSREGLGINTHLRHLLDTVLKSPVSPTAFLTLCIGLFFIVFTASAANLSPAVAILIGFAFASLPYLFLRMKLERLRRRGSFEGETLVAAFLTQYWISNGNVFDALERTIASAESIPITKQLLSGMLIEMRSTGSRERIRRASDAFAYGVGTNWSRMLAYNIRSAAHSGCDISLAIEDILSQLREARALAEERKRINSESIRLVVFMIPLVYFGSFFVSITMLGMSPARFLRNQFMTAEGFGFLILSIFLFFVNLILIEVITNRKLDF